jgi:NitT/TauT family transport system substrate-binding protein
MSPFQDVTSIYVGIAQGFFEEEGIELDISNAGSWGASNELLVAGQTDLATSADADIIPQNEQGVDTTLAFPLYLFAGSALMFMPEQHPDWKTYDDFFAENGDVAESLRLAFEQAQDAVIAIPPNDPTAPAMMEKAGLDPDDFEFLIIEEVDMPPALINGSVDLIRGGIPQRLAVGREGAIALVDQRVLPETLVHAGYSTTRSWLEENPELAIGFLRAMFKTQQYIVDNPDESFALISSELEKQGAEVSPEELAAVWNVMEFFPRSAEEYLADYVDPNGVYYWEDRWQFVLDGYVADGTVSEGFDTPLTDLLKAVELSESLAAQGS